MALLWKPPLWCRTLFEGTDLSFLEADFFDGKNLI